MSERTLKAGDRVHMRLYKRQQGTVINPSGLLGYGWPEVRWDDPALGVQQVPRSTVRLIVAPVAAPRRDERWGCVR